MRRNLWTVLTVFVCMFALASLLNWAKARSPDKETAFASSYAAQTSRADSADPGATAAPGGAAMPGPEGRPRVAGADPLHSPATSPGAGSGMDERRSAERQELPPPVSDTIARTPPNGMLFAGRGKFQLYRQGDVTWRLDTDTGQACILFATAEQWSQQRVFSDGCTAR